MFQVVLDFCAGDWFDDRGIGGCPVGRRSCGGGGDLLQARDGGARSGLHRGRLLLGDLERLGGAAEERVDFVGVIALANGTKRSPGYLRRCEIHRVVQSSYSSFRPPRGGVGLSRYTPLATFSIDPSRP